MEDPIDIEIDFTWYKMEDRSHLITNPDFLMFHVGFQNFLHFHDKPFIPVPNFSNEWDLSDWVAGYGAAFRRAHLPEGWLV